MNEEDWSFFCTNSPMLIQKTPKFVAKPNPKLQGLMSKLKFSNLNRSPKRPEINTQSKTLSKSQSRPIRKLSPRIPRQLFSKNQVPQFPLKTHK